LCLIGETRIQLTDLLRSFGKKVGKDIEKNESFMGKL
jgi:hypothetical protein